MSDLSPAAPIRPTADPRPFHWPVGPTPEARAEPALPPAWYIATAFGDVYEPRPGRPAVHPGLDLNLRSGGDTDFDAPVYASAKGTVTASGAYPVWGDIVVIEHVLPDDRTLWSQYAHLNRRLVAAGQVVERGDQIGTIGKGEHGRYAAHLHFELRTAPLAPGHWPGMRHAQLAQAYIDPAAVIRSGLGVAVEGESSSAAARAIVAGGASTGLTAWPGSLGARRKTPTSPPQWIRSLSGDLSPGALPAVARPLAGKGVFTERLWEIDGGDPAIVARRARLLGLGFVVVKMIHNGHAWHTNLTPDRTSAAIQALLAAGLAVWGWAVVDVHAVDAGLDAIDTATAATGLGGWVVEPLGRPSVDGLADLARRVGESSRRPPGSGDTVLAGLVIPDGVVDDARHIVHDLRGLDVVLPCVRHAGDVGLAGAALAGAGVPLVPVLDAATHVAAARALQAGPATAFESNIESPVDGPLALPPAGSRRAVDDFLYAARSTQRPGAAIRLWETCHADRAGLATLGALEGFQWPAARPDSTFTQPLELPA